MHIALMMEFTEDGLSGVGHHLVTMLRSLSEHGRTARHRFSVFSRQLPANLGNIWTPSLNFVRVSLPPLRGRLLCRLYEDMGRPTLFYHPYPEHALGRPRSMYEARHLASLLARHEVDVCSWYGDDARCPWVDRPNLLTVYDLEHRYQAEFPEVSADGKWLFREEIYSRAIPRAFRVIVDSEEGKEEVVRFYNVRKERVRVLPYLPAHTAAVGEPDNDQLALKRLGLHPGYLFYPAQFWPHKNHIVLLLALRYLRDKHNMVIRLALAGKDAGNLAYVRSMVEHLGLESQVFFLGYVPDKDMPALYRKAQAMVFPSYFGPTNIPPLEAFELGCPVVAADVHGTRAQLGDAALLVDPAAPGQWADAIFRVYSDPLLCRDLVQRGRERRRLWQPEDYVRGIIEILDELQPIVRCWTPS